MANITSGDLPPSAVGNPPTFDFEIALWSAARISRCVFLERRRTILRSSGLQRLRAWRRNAGFGPTGYHRFSVRFRAAA